MTKSAAEEVSEAEAKAVEAQRLAEELETKVLNGDTSVEHEDLVLQKSLADFLRMQVAGARARHAKAIEGDRQKRLASLKAQILDRTRTSGAELAAALKAVEDAAIAFTSLTAARELELHEAAAALGALGIEKGKREHGILVTQSGDIHLDDLELRHINGAQFMGLLFHGDHPLVPSGPYWRRDAAFEDLEHLGGE